MNTSHYRQEYAAYCSELETAGYRYHAGLEPDFRARPIHERYSDLFTREVADALQRVYDATPAYMQTEREGFRLLRGAAIIVYLETRARETGDELAACEAAGRVIWGGESIAANSVDEVIARTPDAAQRRELDARRFDTFAACDDLRAARFETQYESARALDFDSYRALYEDITGANYERLAGAAAAFLERTDAAYAKALARFVARAAPDASMGELQRADYLYFERLAGFDSFFPARNCRRAYEETMRGLGIRVGQQQNLIVDDESRPLRSSSPACFRIAPPADVRLSGAPVAGSFYFRNFFHEAGRAQHAAWSSSETATRHPEFIYAPDCATAEAHATLFQNLFLDAVWLAENSRDTNTERAQEIAFAHALLTAHEARRLCAQLRFEIELHDDSTRLRSEHLAASYAELLTQATGFRHNPALYLASTADGFGAASRLRAIMFEVGWREILRERYGRRWWTSRKAGDELIDIWNTSSRYSVEELARLLGIGEIGFDLLADSLIEMLNVD